MKTHSLPPGAADSPSDAASAATAIKCQVTEGFARWLSQTPGTVAFTTYQAGKLGFVSWDGRQVYILMRNFSKPMGLAVREDQLALVTLNEVLVMANSAYLARSYPPEKPGGYDALFLPRVTYITCDLLVHDVVFVEQELLVVNTRFSCLATLSSRFCCEPRWHPRFISALEPEDRCHLNGIALRDGRPAFVSALGESDQPRGWHPTKVTGGIIIELSSNEIVLRGLCMPHSPRWYENKLWYLNSGKGELCKVEPGEERPTVVCTLPGYLRGLCFVNGQALVGLSLIRERHIFSGLPIGTQNQNLKCGVAAVDLQTGTLTGMLEFTAGCEEIYDVCFVPRVRRGMILNLEDEMSHHSITLPQSGYWMRRILPEEAKEGCE